MAMHSLKDLPGSEDYYSDKTFAIGACLPREDARDVLVMKNGARFDDAEPPSVSAPRRSAVVPTCVACSRNPRLSPSAAPPTCASGGSTKARRWNSTMVAELRFSTRWSKRSQVWSGSISVIVRRGRCRSTRCAPQSARALSSSSMTRPMKKSGACSQRSITCLRSICTRPSALCFAS